MDIFVKRIRNMGFNLVRTWEGRYPYQMEALSNEQFPYRHFFYGHWKDLPEFFLNELLLKWNHFLKNKYQNEESLRRAWGFLLSGENLAQATVNLLPLATPMQSDPVLNDTNPSVIESFDSKNNLLNRDDFTRQRGEDIIAFANELIISHKQRLEKALNIMGKGCLLSPTVYDSGNSFRIQSSYMLLC